MADSSPLKDYQRKRFMFGDAMDAVLSLRSRPVLRGCSLSIRE
jgi:hypothetical protein